MEREVMLERLARAMGDSLWWLFRYGNRHGSCRIVTSGASFAAVPHGVPVSDDELEIINVESVDHILGPWWDEAMATELVTTEKTEDDGAIYQWFQRQATIWAREFGWETLGAAGFPL